MSIFGNKDNKEEKQLEKLRAKLQKHGLENIDSQYMEDCASIYRSLAGVGLMEFGSFISGMKNEEKIKVSYLHAIMNQNWIIIKQLDRITKALEK